MSDERYDDERGNEGEPKQKRSPDYDAFTVRQREGSKPFWNRIGAGFEHKDGEGVDVVLSSLPIDGRISLRRQREEEFKEERRSETQEGRFRDQGRDKRRR